MGWDDHVILYCACAVIIASRGGGATVMRYVFESVGYIREGPSPQYPPRRLERKKRGL